MITAHITHSFTYPTLGIQRKKELENTTFRKLDLIPSSGEGWETMIEGEKRNAYRI
jgi:hypothetical protein